MNSNILFKCGGCAHIQDHTCDIWVCPTAKWKMGICPSATHVDRGLKKVDDGKVRLGQQKQKRKK